MLFKLFKNKGIAKSIYKWSTLQIKEKISSRILKGKSDSLFQDVYALHRFGKSMFLSWSFPVLLSNQEGTMHLIRW